MRGAVLLAALLLASAPALAPALAEDAKEQRTLKNANVGTITLAVPRDWTPTEDRHTESGATTYRLETPQKTFSVEIVFNDLGYMRMDGLTDRHLEQFLERSLASMVPESVEGAATPRRFGGRRDGVYVRLTDRAPKPGESLYLTRGVRLLGRDIVLFTLLSNDRDGAILRDVLEIVDSVSVKK